MFVDIVDLKTGQFHTININQIVEFIKVKNEFGVYNYQIHLSNGTIINLTKKQANRIKNKILKI